MKFRDMPEAVAEIRTTDFLAVPLGPGIPGAFLHALGEREDWVKLDVFGALLPDLYKLFMHPAVRYRSGFFSAAERFLRDSGANVEFVPADFRRFDAIARNMKPRVVATAGAMPVDGRVSLSLHAGATVDELHRAAADPERVVIVEVSPHFPRTFGIEPHHTHSLALDEIDYLIQSDAKPVNLPDAEPSDAERAIAAFAMRYIRDGSTLQTGIGGIPSQIASMVAASDIGDLGIHSEMFTTGLMKLHKAGKVTNRKGSELDGFSVTTFAAGVPELYEWLHENRDVRFLPVGIVNSASHITANRDMVAINGAMAIDLSGQAMADSIEGRQFSGVGGHEDFVGAPGLSVDDRSLLCLPATSTVDGKLVSRIVPSLSAMSIVSTPRHQVDVVITEFGVAELHGRTVRERAVALAEISHPDFRDELRERAKEWPKG